MSYITESLSKEEQVQEIFDHHWMAKVPMYFWFVLASDEMKIASIETVEINQGVFGRIFGYGDVKVTGKGISDVIFSKIDDPIEVKKAIESIDPI